MKAARDPWRAFDLAVARWTLGRLPPADLVSAAVNVLAAGCDLPSLFRLAIMDDKDARELDPVLGRVLGERDVLRPTRDQAVVAIANALMSELLEGRSEPRETSRDLASLATMLEARDGPVWNDLSVFIYDDDLFDDLECGTGQLPFESIANDVLQHAQWLMEHGGLAVPDADPG